MTNIWNFIINNTKVSTGFLLKHVQVLNLLADTFKCAVVSTLN